MINQIINNPIQIIKTQKMVAEEAGTRVLQPGDIERFLDYKKIELSDLNNFVDDLWDFATDHQLGTVSFTKLTRVHNEEMVDADFEINELIQ
jgi:hypothetical protein